MPNSGASAGNERNFVFKGYVHRTLECSGQDNSIAKIRCHQLLVSLNCARRVASARNLSRALSLASVLLGFDSAS